jgi:DNA-binding response OmpR family regulator
MVAKILVVDDEPAIVETLTRFLLREGYEVISALGGRDALDKVEEESPDLILLDIRMSDLDGFTVCQRVKEDERTALIPVVMLTGLDDREHRTRAIEAGADDILTKPFEQSILRARIRTLLRNKRLTDKLARSAKPIADQPSTKSPLATILVVDDDTDLLKVFRIVLEEAGYSVVVCDTGTSAMEYISAKPADLIVLDWLLPDILGSDICRAIKDQYKDVFIPVIVVSARGDNKSIVKMLEAGADDYLTKPFSVEELLARIQALLRRSLIGQGRVKQSDGNSVSMHFDFPEVIKVPCQQYLLYFVEFLRDIGIDATADLKEDAGQVLFSVTPKDKDEALENIWDALGIYLRLPMNRNAVVVITPESSIEAQKLSAELLHLRSQLLLTNAALQQKELAIQQRDIVIQHQQGLIQQQIASGQMLVQALRDDEDSEPVAGGLVRVKRFAWEPIPLEIDIPL